MPLPPMPQKKNDSGLGLLLTDLSLTHLEITAQVLILLRVPVLYSLLPQAFHPPARIQVMASGTMPYSAQLVLVQV
jgi:hypothetical protein